VSVDAGGLFVAGGAVEVLFVFVFGFFLGACLLVEFDA